MTAITDWDRFEAHWQSLKDLIDKTTDVELLDSIAADLHRLVNHASERCTELEAGAAAPEAPEQPPPITPATHPGQLHSHAPRQPTERSQESACKATLRGSGLRPRVLETRTEEE